MEGGREGDREILIERERAEKGGRDTNHLLQILLSVPCITS